MIQGNEVQDSAVQQTVEHMTQDGVERVERMITRVSSQLCTSQCWFLVKKIPLNAQICTALKTKVTDKINRSFGKTTLRTVSPKA